MPKYKKYKARTPKRWILPVITIGLMVVLVLLIVGNVRISQEREASDSKVKTLNQEINGLTQERASLEAEISQSQLPEYWEKIVREELNFKKSGEKVVAFPVVEETQEQEQNIEGEVSFWQRILEKFGIERD